MISQPELAARAIQCLLEGCSIRSTERITGLNRNTIMRLLVLAGHRSQRIMDAMMRGLECRYFTRLTNAFSKKLSHLKAAVALHFAYYNFCRVHTSLRVTPAMEAGLTAHVWSVAELLGTA